jgi:hypothetical protein
VKHINYEAPHYGVFSISPLLLLSLDPNILLSYYIVKHLQHMFFHSMREQVSQMYKTSDKLIIFDILDSRRKGKKILDSVVANMNCNEILKVDFMLR